MWIWLEKIQKTSDSFYTTVLVNNNKVDIVKQAYYGKLPEVLMILCLRPVPVMSVLVPWSIKNSRLALEKEIQSEIKH